MKKVICPFLILGLTLICLTTGHAQEANLDTLRAADVNADGTINILDITFIASHFGKAVAADQMPNPDVTGDGIVNILDLVLVAGQMGKTVRPLVAFVSVNPVAESQLEINDTITLTFDNMPEDVEVSTGVATIADQIVTIAGSFAPGALALTITWLDGTQTLTYTIRQPATFVSAVPVANAQLEVNGTITLTFDSMPEDVRVSTGVATIADQTVTIAGPFDPGDLALTITWKDGSQTLNYTVRHPATFVRSRPVDGANLDMDDTITLTFDNPPEGVEASAGVATVDGKAIKITGPFEPGDLALTITWLDGTQTLTYTVRPPVAFVRARPAAGATLDADDTITLTFDRRPEDITVSSGDAETTGRFVDITGPFDPGPLALTITWKDGSQTLTYTVRTPDTDAPRITGGTVSDGNKDIKSDVVNTRARIEIDFNEEVTGNIALQTTGGVDVGWLGKVDGKKGILELVRGKELDSGTTYVITGKVSDAAGNETDLDITFTTESRTSGIPFTVTDATFATLVLGSEVPVVLEFWKDG